MTQEFSDKLIGTLVDISKNLERTPFWKDYAFWSVAVAFLSVIVLAFTLRWLIRYTRATEKMLEHQMMPAVDVNMIYDSNSKNTHFWFSNSSNIPALVSLEVKKGDPASEHSVSALRIAPNHPHYSQLKRTGPIAFLGGDMENQLAVVLKINVTPAIDGTKIKMCFTKSYRFNSAESRWDETSWGYPDPQFPIQS